MAYEDKNVEELIRLNIALTKENNRLLKKMRRDAVMGRFFKLIMLAAFILIPLFVYHTYLKPTLEEVQQVYTDLQADVNAVKNLENTIPEWARALLPGEAQPQQ